MNVYCYVLLLFHSLFYPKINAKKHLRTTGWVLQSRAFTLSSFNSVTETNTLVKNAKTLEGAVASWLVLSGFEPRPGTLCCVLGQGTLRSLYPGV